MAEIQSYRTVNFSAASRFLNYTPSGGSTSLTTGQEILDAVYADVQARGGLVVRFDTLDEVLATNLPSGTYVITGGESVLFDGDQGCYRVSDPGSGGTVMDNGNEAVLLFRGYTGDAGNFNVGDQPEELPTNEIADQLRVKNIPSISQLPPATGSGRKVSVTGYHAGTTVGGGDMVDAGLARHDGVIYHDPNRSGEIGTSAYYVDSGVDADCWVRLVKNNTLSCEDCGITPDGVTDWGDTGNGILRYVLQHSSTSGNTIVFVPGWYASTFDNYWSNVSVHFEKGAVFGGTIHAAINNDINSPLSQRPANVRFTGEVASYQRVGCYNCDGLFIESILIKEDAAKDFSGFRGAGIHFYNGSTDVTVGNVVIENSERSYGFGIDTADASNPPKNVNIQSIHVKSSYTHGGYIKGDGVYVGEIIIDNFGTGALTDPSLSLGLPGYTGGALTSFRGFVCESSGEVRVKTLKIKGNVANSDSSFGFENRNNSRSVNFGDVSVRDTVSHGVLNYGTLIAESVNARVCGSRGVYNVSGAVNVRSIDCAQNVGTSLYVDGGVLESESIKIADDLTGGIAFVNAPELKIGRIYCANTNANSTSQAQILFANNAHGRVDSINVLRNGAFESASVVISRSGDGVLSIGHLESDGGGDSASSLGAIHAVAADNFHIDDIDLKNSVFTSLRLITSPNNFSIKGGKIDNSTAGIATDTVVGLTNAGFMNVTNLGSTNINALGVETFNCVNVTL